METTRALAILDHRVIEMMKVYKGDKQKFSILMEVRSHIGYLRVGVDVERLNPDGSDHLLMDSIDRLVREHAEKL
jgi:hypothetical protein